MKKIFFLALVGAAIAACQQSGERVPDTGDTKSVSIAVRYAAPATRVPSTYAVTNDIAVTALEDATLYFFNSAGLVVHTHPVSDASQTSFIVGNVPGAATSVGLIANRATDLTAAAPTTFAEFKAMSMGIAGQAEMSGAGLGEGIQAAPDAIHGIAMLDGAGRNTGNSANALTPVTATTHTHETAITLSPAVSRIEIAPGALKVKPGNAKNLDSFNFAGLYVNNYSPTFTLGFTQAATLFGAGIQTGGNPDWAAAYMALDPCTWLRDPLSPASAVTTTTGVGGYVYHVFPGAPMPHIIIRGDTFAHDDEIDTGTRYWLIDKYYAATGENSTEKGAPITAFAPGHVYRISSIAVGDTYPTDDPYDQPIAVEVTVTVTPWHVQETFVEPN